MHDTNCSFSDFKFVEEKSNNFNIKPILFKWHNDIIGFTKFNIKYFVHIYMHVNFK